MSCFVALPRRPECQLQRTDATVTRMPASQQRVSEPVQLNGALRELIEVVRTADLDGVDLTAAIARVRALRDDLAPLVVPGIRMQSSLVFDDAAVEQAQGGADGPAPPEEPRSENPSEFFPYSPLVGPLNPVSPPATMRRVAVDDRFEIHGEATFGSAFNGPPDCVHGGVVAALFDELLGCACVVNGIGGYTGTLTVVYRTPTPLGAALTLRGRVERRERRKVFAAGTIHSGDTLCAQADGIFVQSENLRNPTGF